MKNIKKPYRLKAIPGLVLAVLSLLSAGQLAWAAPQSSTSCPGQVRLISTPTDYDVDKDIAHDMEAAGALKVVRKFDFTTNTLPPGVGHLRNNIEDFRVEDGFLKFRTVGNDSWFTLPDMDTRAEEVNLISVRAAFESLTPVRTERFEILFSKNLPPKYRGELTADIQPDGKLRTLFLFTGDGAVTRWKGKIRKLRVDTSVSSRQEVAIQEIALLRVQKDFDASSLKVARQGVAQSRAASTVQNLVFSSFSLPLNWTLTLPCEAELHTKVALPGIFRYIDWRPFQAVIEVRDETGQWITVVKVPIDQSETNGVFDGVHMRANLARWSGQTVTIRLRAVGPRDGSAPSGLLYWVNPYVTSGQGVPDKPNIILVSIDTLRADHLGLYGYGRRTSPHLDEWSKKAVVFENAFSHSPWTLPSHVSMFTSLYPSQHQAVFSFLDGENYFQNGKLSDTFVTIAEKLQDAGYITAGFTGGGYVSWHYNIHQGYDYWYQPFRFARDLDRVLSWLTANVASRFFLFLHTYEVHQYGKSHLKPDVRRRADAFYPNYQGKVKDADFNFSSHFDVENYHKTSGLNREDFQYLKALYDSRILGLDQELSRFFSELSRLGLDKNTMVIVTSDHGEEFNEHGGLAHGHSLYDELIHVPLVICRPHRLPRGRRVTEQVELVDLYPTILEFAGLDVQSVLEGRSLFPLMADHSVGPERIVFFEDPRKLLSGVRSAGGKYIYRAGDVLTFDMSKDPLEQQPGLTPPDAEELAATHNLFSAKNGGYHLFFKDQRLDACPIRLTTDGRFMSVLPRFTEGEDLLDLKEDRREIRLTLDLKGGDVDGLYFLVLPESAQVTVDLCSGNGASLDDMQVSFGANGPRPVGASWTIGEDVDLGLIRVQSSPVRSNGDIQGGVAFWKLETRTDGGDITSELSEEQKDEHMRRLRSLGYVQ